MSEVLGLLFLLSAPFWSLPFLPGTYASVTSVIALPFAGLFLFQLVARHRKLHVVDILVLLLFLSLVLFNLGQFFVSDKIYDMGRAGIALSSWILALILYFGARSLFSRSAKYDKAVVFFSVVLIIFFVSEALTKSLVPEAFHAVTLLFSGHASSRLIGTVSEPAWAAHLLVSSMVIVGYALRLRGFNNSWFLLLAILTLILSSLMHSLYGYLVLTVLAVLYVLYNRKSGGARSASVAAFLAVSGALLLLNVIDGHTGPYYVSRFAKLLSGPDGNDLIPWLLSIDGSFAIRIGYPVFGLQLALEHPLGIGLGQFGHYLDNAPNWMVEAFLTNQQYLAHISNHNADPRSLFVRVVLEGGVVTLGMLILVLREVYKVIVREFSEPHRFYLLTLFIVSCIFVLQFSTAHATPLWVTIAYIISVSERNKRAIADVNIPPAQNPRSL